MMPGGAQFVPGMIFGKDFQVVSKLAAGGMGTVYVALQLSTGKQRALKVMHSQYEGDSKARARFIQEARAGASIDSDHIVETVGAGVDEETGSPWLAMELLKGQDLKQTLADREALPPDEVLEIFRQMCHALAAAHAVGLVHRDLKPENIFLAVPRREGIPFTVKILDFGIAKLVAESTVSSNHTQAVGSPRWMAPEQAERGGEIRPATDVWALGLIAFQLFTGMVFWKTANTEKPSVMQQMCEVLMDPIEPPSLRAEFYGRGGLIPPGFDAWFAQCVNRDADLRFQDASQAMAAFNAIFEDAGISPVSSPLRGTTQNRRLGSMPPAGQTAGQRPVTQRRFPSMSGQVLAAPKMPAGMTAPGMNPAASFARAPTPARGNLKPQGSNPEVVGTSSPRVRQPTPSRVPTYQEPAYDAPDPQDQEPGAYDDQDAQSSYPPDAPFATGPRSDDAYDLGDTSGASLILQSPASPGHSGTSGRSGPSLTLVAVGIASVFAIAAAAYGVASMTSHGNTVAPQADAQVRAAVDAAVAAPLGPSTDVPGQVAVNLPEAVGDASLVEPLIPPEIVANGRPTRPGRPGPNTAPTPAGRADAAVAPVAPTVAPEFNSALREQVGDAIQRRRGDVTQCFDRAARGNPEIGGRLEVNFVLDPSGHVSSTHTRGIEAAPEVGTCVTALVQGMTFPTSAGEPQLFSFTFHFDRAAPAAAPPTPPTPATPSGATPDPTPVAPQAPAPTPPAEPPAAP